MFITLKYLWEGRGGGDVAIPSRKYLSVFIIFPPTMTWDANECFITFNVLFYIIKQIVTFLFGLEFRNNLVPIEWAMPKVDRSPKRVLNVDSVSCVSLTSCVIQDPTCDTHAHTTQTYDNCNILFVFLGCKFKTQSVGLMVLSTQNWDCRKLIHTDDSPRRG